VFRLFKHYVPRSVLLLAMLDFLLLIIAAETGWVVRAAQISMDVDPMINRAVPLVSFAISIQLAMIAVGVYGVDALHSVRFAAARLLVAMSFGVILISMLFFAFPGATLWRSNALYAMAFSYTALITVRFMFGSLLGSEGFKRRLLVLGAGPRAARIRALAAERGVSFIVVGHVAMNDCESIIPTAISKALLNMRPCSTRAKLCSRLRNGATRCRSLT
jgi:FlaA1/EpsC-like NDP-sugar epimerase